jgi:hypothetical protein
MLYITFWKTLAVVFVAPGINISYGKYNNIVTPLKMDLFLEESTEVEMVKLNWHTMTSIFPMTFKKFKHPSIITLDLPMRFSWFSTRSCKVVCLYLKMNPRCLRI